jgi:hypothetical protein
MTFMLLVLRILQFSSLQLLISNDVPQTETHSEGVALTLAIGSFTAKES